MFFRALLFFLMMFPLWTCGGDSGDARDPVAAIEPLPSPAAPGSGEPHLFGTGPEAWLSWIEPAGEAEGESEGEAAHALRFAVWDEAGWSEPRTVAQGGNWFVNWADFPSLVRLPDGGLAAHWLARIGPETYAYEVRIATSEDAGATWSEPIVPHRDGTPTEHGFVSLFPAPGGAGLGAVWLDGRNFAAAGEPETGEGASHDAGGAEMTLRYAVIGPDGSLADETLLDGRACECCQTGAAVTARGPVVVYRDRSADEVRDIAVIRLVDGRWTVPRTVHDDGWEIAACPVNGPAIAADRERVAVAWFTAAGDTARVLLAFSDDAGATFGPPARIDEGAPAGRVDVALLSDGSALATWIERAGGEAAVRVRRVGAHGTPGPAVRVAATTEDRASGFPQMALAGERVLFAWTEPGEPSRVRVAAASLESLR
ncbi:MAG TPA: sialidase family protein [Gemmatimonadota bacterium]|nr:sialidase family protein [Gemmatimonadota bacterium]